MKKLFNHQFCSANGWAEKALNCAQWNLENGLTALSLVVNSLLLSGKLGYWAYIIHLVGLVLYPEQRPKDGVDWFKEIINLICFAISVLIVFGVTIPPLIQNVATIVTLVLLFAAIADKLTA